MILTIDVGLKNLAFCVMSCNNNLDMKTYNIHLWQVVNTLEEQIPKCESLTKKEKICGKKCCMKYLDTNGNIIYSCKPHFPKDIPIVKTKNIIKKIKVKECLLQDIALSVINAMNNLINENVELFSQITKIHIELQPKINNKMKLVSHIIYGKLVETFQSYPHTQIRFIRAAQKLKIYKGPVVECNLKSAYSKRKYLSIQYTKWILLNCFCDDQKIQWYDFFDNNSKKDDLSDVYLMALNGIK
jgi:hypothetical protein